MAAVGKGRPAAPPAEKLSAIISALVAERIRQGISQEEIVAKIGVNDRNYLSKLENGRHGARLEYVERYAAALGMRLTLTREEPDGTENRLQFLIDHFTDGELRYAANEKKKES